ncbi:VOC family protein [Halobacillus seohaensis]|uniref:VOC family protein n=1 Tax=Halobacillus seohaensis TaxID=447421 RepID=A0ABW2ES81_9BACI
MQQQITPYLTFNGHAKEAIEFYKTVLDAEVTDLQTFGETKFETPPELDHRILHARLQKGPILLMFSDNFSGEDAQVGSQISLVMELKDEEEIKRIYHSFCEEGTIFMELQDTFWGATFAKVKDKFGITWDLNLQK